MGEWKAIARRWDRDVAAAEDTVDHLLQTVAALAGGWSRSGVGGGSDSCASVEEVFGGARTTEHFGGVLQEEGGGGLSRSGGGGMRLRERELEVEEEKAGMERMLCFLEERAREVNKYLYVGKYEYGCMHLHR